MFDVSFVEIAVIIGFGFALIGKRESCRYANLTGRYLGRTVATLSRSKEQFQSLQDPKLIQLQQDVSRKFQELNLIKSDIRMASMLRQGMAENQSLRMQELLSQHSNETQHNMNVDVAEFSELSSNSFVTHVEQTYGGADLVSSSILQSIKLAVARKDQDPSSLSTENNSSPSK